MIFVVGHPHLLIRRCNSSNRNTHPFNTCLHCGGSVAYLHLRRLGLAAFSSLFRFQRLEYQSYMYFALLRLVTVETLVTLSQFWFPEAYNTRCKLAPSAEVSLIYTCVRASLNRILLGSYSLSVFPCTGVIHRYFHFSFWSFSFLYIICFPFYFFSLYVFLFSSCFHFYG